MGSIHENMAALRNLQLVLLPKRQLIAARNLHSGATLLQNVPASANSNANAVHSLEEPRKVSKAMKVYMERAKEHDDFIKLQLHNFNVGKRHLANMMGRDPDFFTQEDIDEAVKYLFPSGLFDPRARPMMKHPEEIYPKKKEAEFDITGRPYHSLFYTSKPNYYQLLHDINTKLKALNNYEDMKAASASNETLKYSEPPEEMNLNGSEWLSKLKMEGILLEKLNDRDYSALVKTLDRLSQHPFAHKEKKFIMEHRSMLAVQTLAEDIPALLLDEAGRSYMKATGRRKTAHCEVTVMGQGTGRVDINGRDLLYFENKQEREQVLFPIEFTGLLGLVDVKATVSGGGPAGQAGALRYAIATCLRSFVTGDMMERMRLAGLLSFDPRTRERKKPGQAGARKKFTWKKR